MRNFTLGWVLLLFSASTTLGGGYQVSLHGNKQIGMGLIGTSLSLDASAAFYNPGALAFMPQQYSFLGGASGIFASTAFQMAGPSMYEAKTDNPLGTPFYFYAGAKITDRLAAGLAINTPYGNSLAWEDGWAGRYLIQEISLRAITFQPTLSWKVTDFLSVGGGLVYATGAVDMTRALPVEGYDGEGRVNIQGNASNLGFNAGVLYVHPQGIQAGLSYRSRIDMEVEGGDAFFHVPPSLSNMFPAENQVDVMLPLPANLDFGLSWQVNPDLMLGMALNYVFWEAYEELSFDFATNTDDLADSESPREYSNTLIIRAGAEYRLRENLFLRGGTYYDPSPVNDQLFSPETPSLDNLAFTAGLSFLPNARLSIDVSLLYIMGLEDDKVFAPENFGGTYQSRVIIPGLGISYQL